LAASLTERTFDQTKSPTKPAQIATRITAPGVNRPIVVLSLRWIAVIARTLKIAETSSSSLIFRD